MFETRYNQTSKFWMSESEWSRLNVKYGLSKNPISLSDVVEKATILKTISNFIHIIANTPISVKFEGQESKTDGNEVFISSDVTDFDTVCGLSLHEASHLTESVHILAEMRNFKSDFSKYAISKNINEITSVYVLKFLDVLKRHNVKYISSRDYVLIQQLLTQLMDILNIIEDFRVDTRTKRNYPGYKGYYDALVHKYVFTPEVEKSLLNNNNLKKESLFAYKANLSLFIHNHPLNHLMSFSGGPAIVKILDRDNIADKTDDDILNMSIDIFDIILKSVEKPKNSNNNSDSNNSENSSKSSSDGKENKSDKNNKSDKKDESKSSSNKDSKSNSDSSETDDTEESDSSDTKNTSHSDSSDTNDASDETESDSTSDESDSMHNTNNDKSSTKKSTDNFRKQIQDDEASSSILDNIHRIVKGTFTTKKPISDDENIMLTLLGNRFMKIKPTWVRGHKIDVAVIYKLTEEVVTLLNGFAFAKADLNKLNQIKEGINLGKALGKKLQIMNDIHLVKNTRKDSGALENRLLSEIGHGNVKVFSRKRISEFEKQFVHISIDTSGSMNGENITAAFKLAATIASAATTVNGMRVQVSVRSTAGICLSPNSYSNMDTPHVVIIYDSKFDKLSHITKWWPRLSTPGLTPEAICFEAVQDVIMETSKDKNSFFVNISDGSPCYNTSFFNYENFSTEHTQEIMAKFRKSGIKILSYLIDQIPGIETSTTRKFKRMYGSDAVIIDTTNLNEVARTLNKKFLGK